MEKYVAQIERSLLLAALNQSHGVQTKAADVLGFRPNELMEKLGVQPEQLIDGAYIDLLGTR